MIQSKRVFFANRRSAAVVSQQTFPVAFERLNHQLTRGSNEASDSWWLKINFLSGQLVRFSKLGSVRPGSRSWWAAWPRASFCSSSWANRNVPSVWLFFPLVSLSVSCRHVLLRETVIVPLSCVSYRSWNRYRGERGRGRGHFTTCYIKHSPANMKNVP